jgi:hypothetical protein
MANTDQANAALQQIIATDPEIQRLLAMPTSVTYTPGTPEAEGIRAGMRPADWQQQVEARLNELGFQVPEGSGYYLDFDDDGISIGRDSWYNRNANWVIPAAFGGIVAGPLIAGAGAGGGGGAGGGALATGTGTGAGAGAGAATVPTIAGGTSLTGAAGLAPGTVAGAGGSTVGLAGAGVTGGGGALSMWDKIFGAADKLSPVLGGAADARAQAQDTNANQALAQSYYRLNAPGQRLRTGLRADMARSATPVRLEGWNGPGSGLRGERPRFTGGANIGNISEQGRGLADQVLNDTIEEQLTGGNLPEPGESGFLDDLLGWGSLATGVGGAINTFRRPNRPRGV